METKIFTLNTKTTFANIDDEMNQYEEFLKKNPFGKTLKKFVDCFKDELERYDIGLGITCNELEEFVGMWQYGFDAAPTTIGLLLGDIRRWLSNNDYCFICDNWTASVKLSNRPEVAKLYNKMLAIATA